MIHIVFQCDLDSRLIAENLSPLADQNFLQMTEQLCDILEMKDDDDLFAIRPIKLTHHNQDTTP